MAKNRLTISKEVMDWAVEYSDLSEEKIYAQFPWACTSPIKATFKQLEQFAKKTRVPFRHLFLDQVPTKTRNVQIPDFRTVGDKQIREPSLNLLDIIHIMSRRQEWMRDYLLDEQALPIPFIGSLAKITNPITAAKKIREDLGLEPGWQKTCKNWKEAMSTLLESIEDVGVLFFMESCLNTSSERVKFCPEEFRGFILSDSYAPLLFVNTQDSNSAQMFTVAHELAHLWRGDSGLYDFSVPTREKEKFSNSVAAEFLVPQAEFKQAWNKDHDFGNLSKKFKVSPLVIARRANDLHLLSDDEYWDFYKKQQEEWKKRKKTGGGNYYSTRLKNLSANFSMAVTMASMSGKILLRDAYSLLNMKTNSFNVFTSKLLAGERK